jgi:hypothetical protein
MKKIVIWIVAPVSVLLLSLIIFPYVFKDKILNAIKNTANENINARIGFSNDINLSLLRHFPDFTVGVKDLNILGIGEFEKDTLLSLNQLNVTVDLMSVITGHQMKIERLEFIKPMVHAIILENGHTNLDIVKTDADTTPKPNVDTTTSAFTVKLRHLGIENATIKYEDRQGQTFSVIENFNHNLSGDFTQDLVDLKTSNSIDKLTVSQSGITYLNKAHLEWNASIDADLKSNTYTLKENEIKLNQLIFTLIGSVSQTKDDMNVDLAFKAQKAGIREFLSLIPGMYTKDFEGVKTSGNLSFTATAKGKYTNTTIPAFNLTLNVSDASIQYPSLPTQVKNIQIDLNISNSDGVPNNTVVNLNRFLATIADDEFEARLLTKNLVTDPFVDAALKGRINMSTWSKAIPLSTDTKLSGIIDINILAKGFASQIENKLYDKFDARGEIKVTNVSIQRQEKPKVVTIREALITLSPTYITVNPFKGNAGLTDFDISGEINNFIPYALKGDKIQGKLSLKSGTLNVNELLSEENQSTTSAVKTSDTVKLSAPEVPANIDFTFNSNIGKIIYSNIVIENLKGEVVVRNKQIRFNEIKFNTLGSAITLNGNYNTEIASKPSTEMELSIKNLDIKKAAITFNTIKKLAPVAENMNGSISANVSLKTALNSTLEVDYNSLVASGQLEVENAAINDVKVFNMTAEILKNENWRNPGIENVKIRFSIEKGKITTEPFDMIISGQKLTLYGTTGLDQSINYTGIAQLPTSVFGNIAASANKTLAELNKKAGTNVKSSGTVNVKILINGTFSNPLITTNLTELAKNEAGDIAKQLKDEAERKRKELEDKARQEFNKAKAETEAKAKAEAEKIRREAEQKLKSEEDRIKKEAEQKAKSEKEKLKKQAEEEAKKKLKGIFKP